MVNLEKFIHRACPATLEEAAITRPRLQLKAEPEMWARALLIRTSEERLLNLFSEGKLFAPFTRA